MQFEQALTMMRKGFKVQRKNSGDYYLEIKNNSIISRNLNMITVMNADNILANDWEVYQPPLTFGDIRVGEKFVFEDKKYTKLDATQISGLNSQGTGLGIDAGNLLKPIKHIAYTSKDGNVVNIDPYDTQLMGTITKFLRDNKLNAYEFSKTRICVNIPLATREEKEKVIKQLKKMGEDAKIAIRHIRRSYRDSLTNEEIKSQDKEIQKITDDYVRSIDGAITTKIGNL